MPNSPYVLCHFPDCEYRTQPIVLPLSNPPGNDPHQLLWPPGDWRAYLACPGCGQVLLRTARDVRWKELSMQDQNLQEGKHWHCIAYECDINNCGTPVEFHVLRETKVRSAIEFYIFQNLRDGWSGASPCPLPHPLTAKPEQVDIHLNEGAIRGYYPPILHLVQTFSVTCSHCGESCGGRPREDFQIGNRIECKACYRNFTVTAEHISELEE